MDLSLSDDGVRRRSRDWGYQKESQHTSGKCIEMTAEAQRRGRAIVKPVRGQHFTHWRAGCLNLDSDWRRRLSFFIELRVVGQREMSDGESQFVRFSNVM